MQVKFLAQHPCKEVNDSLIKVSNVVQLKPWILTFNGLRSQKGVGAGIMITSLTNIH